MADNTIILQGSLTQAATAVPQTIVLESGVDWMRVWNYTVANGSTEGGVEWFWQKGMAANDALVHYHAGAALTTSSSTAAGLGAAGFTYIDSSVNVPVGNVAITAISTAALPIVSTGTTTGLGTGTIVRFNNVAGAPQFGGIDFSIDTVVASTSFRLPYASQLSVAGTTGKYSIIPFNPLFYPARRTISLISQASSAVVTTTVAHNYVAGQLVRFVVPAAFGMTQLNGLLGTVTAVTTGTFTVNIDTSAFTAFAFPLAAAVPFTLAEVIPVGETAASPYQNLLDDSTINTGYTGMLLGYDATYGGPAGFANNVIYWTAGKSFSSN